MRSADVHELTAACATSDGARAIALRLTAGDADAALAWAIAQSARSELALAPLIQHAAHASSTSRAAAARARVMHGPLQDAAACVSIVVQAGSLDPPLRARVDAIFWELSARGSLMPGLATAAIDAVVLDAITGDLGTRVRAARALGVVADGLVEASGLQRTALVTHAATTWLAHPEPALWGAAARALGRLAGQLATARRVIYSWATSGQTWQRRRIGAAIASIPNGRDTDAWVEAELARRLDHGGDPWMTAALGIAAPHLARERVSAWHRLLDVAVAAPIEIGWSLARGIASLARRGARTTTETEREVMQLLRERIAREVPKSTEDAARAFEADVHLGWAFGEPPPPELAYEAADDAIRIAFDERRAPALTTTNAAFHAALAQLDAPDERQRGHAHAALRSATRARATRIHELVAAAGGAVTELEDAAPLREEIAARLAKEVCEYGLRSTLVGCLGDLIDAVPPGPTTSRGRVAALALRAIAESRWACDELRGASDPKARARTVRRFRKPLEDIFDRIAVRDPDAQQTVPPSIAGWWTLCGGGAVLVTELEREADAHDRAALAAIEQALRDAARGMSPARWGEGVLAALDELGAGESALARVLERLAAVLETLSTASDERDELAARWDELADVVDSCLDAACDLDGALSSDGRGVAAGPTWIRGQPRAAHDDRHAEIARWERELPSSLRALIVPLARGLVAALGRRDAPRRSAGMKIGPFELISQLGGGGMGEVWKARRGRQLVALKLPHATPEMIEVLRGEASRLEGMSLAKVVTFIEGGVEGDVPFFATSYLRGRTWAEHALAPGAPRLDPALGKRIAREICIGLANLHELRIVHRDVTPKNVFLRFRGEDTAAIPELAADPLGRRIDEAVLIDLGLAQRVGAEVPLYLSAGYVAPEILRGDPVGPAADVYGLAATLFHVLTGHRFAHGLSRMSAVAWHLAADPFEDPDVRRAAASLPASLRDLLAEATRLDPSRRPLLESFDVHLADS